MNYIKLLQGALSKFYIDTKPGPIHLSLYVALFQLWNANRFVYEFSIVRREVMKLSKIGSHSSYHRAIKALDEWGYIDYEPSSNAYEGSLVRMKILKETIKAERARQLQYDGFPDDETKRKKRRSRKKTSMKQDNTPREPEQEQGQTLARSEQALGPIHPESEQVVGRTRPESEQAVGYTRPESAQGVGSIYKHNKQKETKASVKASVTKNEVIEFFETKGQKQEEAALFFDYYQDKNWHTKNGEPIKDWKAMAIFWIRRSHNIYGPNASVAKEEDHLKTTKFKNYAQPL